MIWGCKIFRDSIFPVTLDCRADRTYMCRPTGLTCVGLIGLIGRSGLISELGRPEHGTDNDRAPMVVRWNSYPTPNPIRQVLTDTVGEWFHFSDKQAMFWE